MVLSRGRSISPSPWRDSSKLGCTNDDVKMYYAAWLQAKGFTKDQISEGLRNAPKTNAFQG